MTDKPLRVLLACTGNSARSILGEALLARLGQGRIIAVSGGTEPGSGPNPAALRLLAENGFDTAPFRSKSWEEFTAPGTAPVDIVITLCDDAAAAPCPVFPGPAIRAHWSLPDPAAAPEAARDAAFAETWRQLDHRLRAMLALPLETMDAAALRAALEAIGRNAPEPADASTPQIEDTLFQPFDGARLAAAEAMEHRPRILLLYGSLRERSFSRLMAEEAARVLHRLGAETRIFNPSGLPLPDDAPAEHPKVAELREMVTWCEGMVWTSPERHGAMTGIMKAQVDWIPLSLGGVRPTQGKTLAVMQVSGGSQSFNTVNQLRILGRWMRLLTIPNQSSVPKAWTQFGDDGRMKPSPFYDRMVDVMEELVKFTMLTRGRGGYLLDRYSERAESREALSKRVNQADI